MAERDKKVEISDKIVRALDAGTEVVSHLFAKSSGYDHQEVVGALKSLAGRLVVVIDQFDVPLVTLTAEGDAVCIFLAYFSNQCYQRYYPTDYRKRSS